MSVGFFISWSNTLYHNYPFWNFSVWFYQFTFSRTVYSCNTAQFTLSYNIIISGISVFRGSWRQSLRVRDCLFPVWLCRQRWIILWRRLLRWAFQMQRYSEQICPSLHLRAVFCPPAITQRIMLLARILMRQALWRFSFPQCLFWWFWGFVQSGPFRRT